MLSGNTDVIDCDTDSEEIYYFSLLTHFCLLIGLSPPKKPATLCHILPPRPELIVGRDNELHGITEMLTQNNCAILTVIGGIGKSAVAIAYAYDLNERDDCIIQHIICEETHSLQDAIALLQFDGIEYNSANNETCRNKVNALQANIKPALILFDNLNHPFSPEEKTTFQELLKCKYIRFLITSRRALVNNKQLVIEIDPLDNDALLDLYTYHRFRNPDDNRAYIQERYDVLMDMFELVGRHTLMIELIAKLPMRSGQDEYEINQYVSNCLNISDDQLSVTKDGIDNEDTIQGIIKGIFSVSKFDELEKNIMRHMSLVPLCGIELKLFVMLTGCDRTRINRLKDSHWIQMDEQTLKLSLHPLICDTVHNTDEIKPSEQTCHPFLTALQEKIDSSTPQGSA